MVIAAFLISSTGAYAQASAESGTHANEGLNDIVVTANKRGAESLQRVPASVAAVGGETLQKTGAQGIQDYAGSLPGLAVFDTGPNQKKLKIRGVSGSSESEPQETVGIYLDDVSITSPGGTNNENNASPDLNLFDIERIEVLKGPQGTLYGAGSMGGTIRFITKQPQLNEVEGEVQGRLSTTRSGDPSYGGDAVVNLPIAEKVAVRVVGTYRYGGGYIDNISAGYSKKNYSNDKSWLVRGSALYKPTDTVDLQLKYLHRDVAVNGLNSVPRNERLTADYLVKPESVSNMDLINGIINANLGAVVLTSSTSYLDRRDLQSRDLTPLGRAYISAVSTSTEPAPAFSLLKKQGYHEFAQELRLASDNSSSLKYVVGAYYSKLSKRYREDAPWPGLADFFDRNGTPSAVDGKEPFVSPVTGVDDLNFYSSLVTQDLRQLAVFGEFTYSLNEIVDLTAGGRYFDIKQNYHFLANPLSIFVTQDASVRNAKLKEDGFNPKATVSIKPGRNFLVFGTVAKGFRPGGFNQPVSSNPQCLAEFAQIGFNPNDVPGFQSDALWSYELGVKGSLAERRVQFNGSVYQIDWKDIQLRNQLSCGFTIFDTASSARIKGLEGTLNARLAEGLTIGLNGAYTDAKLRSAKITTGGVAGDRLLGIPKYTLSGSVEYEHPVSASTNAFVRVDTSYVGSYDSYFSTELYGGAPKNRKIGDFSITNVRAGVAAQDDGWEAQIFVNNLFDKLGDTGAQVGIFGDVVFRTRPREIGLQVRRRF